ncbi:hypothetical protein GPECTOR_40g585 [Gonium pectorale]|uniref:Uncharacterized protein n=1 Tax=Gonium pectorale TaxID=33097 RepID=A0A150GAH8_GONPE|nr:hypothetical protein GPECTOR_40g585 [Gonium pectorale]|eukprot:KXZ46851.1 hypothetical protein GPECTOR_40g585 [Gonium pectorale]
MAQWRVDGEVVFVYEGRAERTRLEVDAERTEAAARAGSSTSWLRPVLAAVDVPGIRFKQMFFVPPEGSVGSGGDGEGGDGGGDDGEGAGGEELQPVYSRLVLPLVGPLDRWWEPIYSRLRVELTLTPVPADAGADLQLLYPTDPQCGGDDGYGDPVPVLASGATGSGRGGAGAAGAEDEDALELGPWELLGSDCLPPGRWWPEPNPLAHPVSPFSGGPRDFLRVVGPGVYVGCGYRTGPGPREYREENFVYFIIVRRE